jgi:beta-galactosidase beta subunit
MPSHGELGHLSDGQHDVEGAQVFLLVSRFTGRKNRKSGLYPASQSNL